MTYETPEFDYALFEQTERNMTNHPPTSEAIASIEDLRVQFKAVAAAVADFCPPSRERSLAVTQLEDSLMWAVASIARA